MSRDERRSRLVWRLLLAAGIGLCLILLAASFLPFRVFGPLVRRMVGTFSDAFTAPRYERLALSLRRAAFVPFVAAALLLIFRNAVRSLLDLIFHRLGPQLRVLPDRLWSGLRNWVSREDRIHLLALGLITSAAAVLRGFYLGLPMREDEARVYLRYAAQPFVALTTYPSPENHVLHTLLVAFSTALFGSAPWAIRLPAFVAGVLLVPFTYLAARLLFDRNAGIVAAALVAGSSVLIEYSVDARGYTLVGLLFVVMICLASRVHRSPNAAAWLLLAVAGALGFYTMPSMLYPFSVVMLWLSLSLLTAESRLRKRLIRYWLAGLMLAVMLDLALYAPILVVSGLKSVVANEIVLPLGRRQFLGLLPGYLVEVWNYINRDVPPVARVAGVLCVLPAVVLRRRPGGRAALLLGIGLLWLVPLSLLLRRCPPMRVWTFLVPLCAILVSGGAALFFSLVGAPARQAMVRLASAGAIVVLAGLGWLVAGSDSVPASAAAHSLPGAQQMASLLNETLAPGDSIAFTESLRPDPLRYYLRRLGRHPTDFTPAPPNSRATRVFLVTGDSLDLMRHFRFSDRFGAPRLVRNIRGTLLIEFAGPAHGGEGVSGRMSPAPN